MYSKDDKEIYKKIIEHNTGIKELSYSEKILPPSNYSKEIIRKIEKVGGLQSNIIKEEVKHNPTDLQKRIEDIVKRNI